VWETYGAVLYRTVPYSSIVIGWEDFSRFLIGSEEKPFEIYSIIH
jgi:hypothetical protein